jgi:hypothetical protein
MTMAAAAADDVDGDEAMRIVSPAAHHQIMKRLYLLFICSYI